MLDDVKNKSIAFSSVFSSKKSQFEDLQSKIADLSLSYQESIDKINLYQKAIEVMKILTDKLTFSHREHLETLLTSVLHFVFYDKDYSIQFELTDHRNCKQLSMYLLDGLTGVKSPLSSNGFGVKTVVGFTLQVYFIEFFHLNPIVFLDEAFSAISEQYLPKFQEFLNSLSQHQHFKFVLVTHDPRLIAIADKVYTINSGEIKKV